MGIVLLALSAGVAGGQTPALVSSAAAAASVPPQPQAPPFKPTLTFGGYVQGELDAGAVGDSRFPASDRFFIRRARLTAGGRATPTLTYRLQAEFAGGLGSASGVTASMTDAYLEWTKIPRAHIRVGQFKAPFGREWLGASTQLPTVERSLASDRLTVNRQIGVELFGDARDGRLGYFGAVVNGNGRNTSVNDNHDFMYIGRANVTPWRLANGARLEIGAGAFSSRDTKLSMAKEFGVDSTPETSAADNLFTGRRSGAGLDGHFQSGVWSV
ncbi:MAG TPA: porin, partial [Thermomicrobiales bacterium]|nr:porin [Thermomicrobiales bacterium]